MTDLVMTIWDWAPIASWNSGDNWPATTWYKTHFILLFTVAPLV